MKREIPDDNRHSALTSELTGSYDERKRTFDALRNPMLSEDERKAAIDTYKAANRAFEAAKAAILK